MTNECNTKAVRASAGEMLLMTVMVSFAPVMLCAMTLLASAI